MKKSLTIATLVAYSEALQLESDTTSPYASDAMKTAWKPGYINPYIYEPEEGKPDPRQPDDQIEEEK